MSNRMTGEGGTIRGLSQELWQGAPLDLLQGFGDPDIGWAAGDDFRNYSKQVALNTGVGYAMSEGNTYRTFENAGGGGTSAQCLVPSNSPWTVPSAFTQYTQNGQGIIWNPGDVVPTPGQLIFTPTATTDQAQLILSPNIDGTTNVPGSGMFTPYPVGSSQTVGKQGAVFFECRIYLSGLTTAFTTFFIGLVGAGAAVGATGNPAGSGSFSTTPSLLGFGCLKSDLSGQIGLVYNKAGGAVSDQATNTALNLLTLGGCGQVPASASNPTYPNVSVAGLGGGGNPSAQPATYIGAYLKLGFKYDPTTGQLTPYINGVAQDGRAAGNNKVLTSTTTAAATGWPADQMTFGFGAYQYGTTYQRIAIDWWRAVQLAG